MGECSQTLDFFESTRIKFGMDTYKTLHWRFESNVAWQEVFHSLTYIPLICEHQIMFLNRRKWTPDKIFVIILFQSYIWSHNFHNMKKCFHGRLSHYSRKKLTLVYMKDNIFDQVFFRSRHQLTQFELFDKPETHSHDFSEKNHKIISSKKYIYFRRCINFFVF